jgi:hypothetical protein
MLIPSPPHKEGTRRYALAVDREVRDDGPRKSSSRIRIVDGIGIRTVD